MNLTKDAKWDPIRNDKRFWEDLPWMSDGKTLWNFIRPYKPDLLSAYTNRDSNCKPGKLKWASKNLGLGVNRVNLVMRSEKQGYAQTGYRSPAILIDDFPICHRGILKYSTSPSKVCHAKSEVSL